MRPLVEVLLALFSVLGLLSLSWLLLGHILAPTCGGRVCAVIPAAGSGEDLEQSTRGILWLKGGALLPGRVVIVDCGLDAGGRALAEALLRREPLLEICALEDLREYITLLRGA